MRSATIAQGERYKLISWGNGLAYCLEDTCEGLDVFVQGDEASDFRAAWDAVETVMADKPHDVPLGYMWDQMGYGAAGRPVVRGDVA